MFFLNLVPTICAVLLAWWLVGGSCVSSMGVMVFSFHVPGWSSIGSMEEELNVLMERLKFLEVE